MSFVDTDPALIDRQRSGDVWSPLRVTDPRQRQHLLLALASGDVPVTIGSAGGPCVTAALWSVEEEDNGGRLHFNIASGASRAAAVIGAASHWAAAYLDDVKLQFQLRAPVLEAAAGRHIVHARLPDYMVRLPRRRSMRVRRTEDTGPTARFLHPHAGGAPLQLRVIDISVDGLAVLKPAGAVPLAPGDELRAVQIALEAGLQFSADLRVRYVAPGPLGQRGSRIGCEWQALNSVDLALLERWIQGGRRRRQLVSLGLD
ncbi:MAG: flagellar regulator YcgR PilZN domain-containing protein [Rubrivivax sp.]